jgi:hypothetical protein
MEAPMESLVGLFRLIDDFRKVFEPAWTKGLIASGQRKRRRATGIALSELMTLVIFYQKRYRQFKAFYLTYVHPFLLRDFPCMPCYQRCEALSPRCAVALAASFESLED